MLGSSAVAAFNPNLLNDAADPSTWTFADLVSSFDAELDGGFNYNPVSGFSWEFLGAVQDRTDVRSQVYRFNQGHTFTTGAASQSVSAGDMAFVYRVRLVGVNTNSVTSLTQAQVVGFPAIGMGQDIMDSSLLLAQGFITGAYNPPVTGNLDAVPGFGSSVDFMWPGSDVTNLDNNQEAVLVMFTSPSLIGQGVLNLFAPPGQGNGVTGIAQSSEAPPILIPIIPGPGPVALGAMAFGLLGMSRRRR